MKELTHTRKEIVYTFILGTAFGFIVAMLFLSKAGTANSVYVKTPYFCDVDGKTDLVMFSKISGKAKIYSVTNRQEFKIYPSEKLTRAVGCGGNYTIEVTGSDFEKIKLMKEITATHPTICIKIDKSDITITDISTEKVRCF